MKNIFIISFISLLFSCTKESFTDSRDALLRTSTDSLHFDTVFTTTGSITQSFKIINEDQKSIHISAVQLMGGAASPFKMVVDGVTGTQVNDIDIEANDSVYVFVTVTINPTAANLPFVVTDSIEVAYNETVRKVGLTAYGQNAHFFRNKLVQGSETWNADLPYVILDGLTVDTAAVLTISKGARIYLHANAPMIVHGSLQVNGEKWDSTRVVFASDRLDTPYQDFPAGWPGIFFSDRSNNNIITYTTVKNAYQGLVIEGGATNAVPKLSLQQTIIENAYDAGLLAINSSIAAQNLLVSNCGKGVILANGGNYQFTHCTVASFSNAFIQHKDPVLLVSNYGNATAAPLPLNALFRNCIFWGESGGVVKDEVVVAKAGTSTFTVSFNSVLWPLQTAPAGATVTNALMGNPQFDSVNTVKGFYSFRLKEGSPALDKGVPAGLLIDLDGNTRPVGSGPDVGAYEKQ